MRILILCFVLLLTTRFVSGQIPDSIQTAALGTFERPVFISDGDSVKYFVGKTISIKGPVVHVKKSQGKDGAMGFMDLFKAYPQNAFSVVIYREALAFFDPLEQYEKKWVRIKGKVYSYKDKSTGNERYSIVLRKPEQIELLD